MVMMTFLCYPNCSTCRKARSWLDEKGISYAERHIRDDRPARSELERWQALSGLPLKRFFNISGQQYKALDLKNTLPGLTEDEQLDLLATDGMLVRRPILYGGGLVLVGFNQADWEAKL